MKIRTTLVFDTEDRRTIGKGHLATREECLRWARSVMAVALDTEYSELSSYETEDPNNACDTV